MKLRLSIRYTWDGKPWWQVQRIPCKDHQYATSWHSTSGQAIAAAVYIP